MKSPREKYMNDPEYHHLVQMLENLIERAKFTPSELREACILASINYETRNIRGTKINLKVEDALQTIDEFMNRRKDNVRNN